MRRGKATAHKVFGEAVAILAGDASYVRVRDFDVSGFNKIRQTGRAIVGLGGSVRRSRLRKARGRASFDITCEGQDVPISTVESIIKRKTGALPLERP